MRWIDVPAAFMVVAWTFMLLAGVNGLTELHGRSAPDYPSAFQIVVYGVIPAAFAASSIASIIFSRRVRWFGKIYPIATGFLVVSLWPIMLLWSAGT